MPERSSEAWTSAKPESGNRKPREALTEPGAAVLLDVLISWMMERYKNQIYAEVLRMLLTKLIRRRFGALPRWASARLCQADLKQLEAWAVNIFDAKELTDLLGPEP